jgi:tripartite-type tricarboxylate transporter receptor subunit TctC
MKPALLAIPVLTGLALFVGAATAQSPTAPIRLLVPLAAGGPSDQAARVLAKHLAKALGQDVLVENKPGANGALGAQAVATSPADGHALLFAGSGMSGLPVLMKSPPFASLTDFVPLGAVGGNQICLFVFPGLPVKTAQEFVAHARANPNKLSYGSSSLGEYLATAQLMQVTGIQMVRIPYRGSAAMLPDLMEGRVEVGFMPAGSGAAHAKTGRLKLLGCNVPQRLPGLPEVPTLAESGVPAIGSRPYHLILAPAKLPQEVATRLTAAIRRAANEPELRAEFERLLIPADNLSPEQVTTTIREGERVWAQFVREVGIAPE